MGLAYLYSEAKKPYTPPVVLEVDQSADPISIHLWQNKDYVYGGNRNGIAALSDSQRKLPNWDGFSIQDRLVALRTEFNELKNDKNLLPQVLRQMAANEAYIQPTPQNPNNIVMATDMAGGQSVVIQPISNDTISKTVVQ